MRLPNDYGNNAGSLSKLYDTITSDSTPAGAAIRPGRISPEQISRALPIVKDAVQDRFAKKVLVDVYVKILPLDRDYKDRNEDLLGRDVDILLKDKGVSANKYITSALDKTKNPLIETIVLLSNEIGKRFMEDSMDNLEADLQDGVPPTMPTADDKEEVSNTQLLELNRDEDYKEFTSRLVDVTKRKIVDDVSGVIIDKQLEDSMTYKSSNDMNIGESVIVSGMNYVNKKVIVENLNDDTFNSDEMMALAIREDALNQLDSAFGFSYPNNKVLLENIMAGHGLILNESTLAIEKEV